MEKSATCENIRFSARIDSFGVGEEDNGKYQATLLDKIECFCSRMCVCVCFFPLHIGVYYQVQKPKKIISEQPCPKSRPAYSGKK